MCKKFTLIELLVVVAIIGILVSILLPSISSARKKASMAVCVSNLKQIANANSMFINDKDGAFIDEDDVLNAGDSNVGHNYVGSGGSHKNTVRPLNIYLGMDDIGTEEIMPVAICPISNEQDQIRFRNRFETSYMGTARTSINNDLDGPNGHDPVYGGEINEPVKMILIGGTGAYHYAKWGAGDWSVDNHGDRKYSLAFVDGHAGIHKLNITEGFSGSKEIVSFEND